MYRRALITLLALFALLAARARTAPDTLGVGTMAAFAENAGQWDPAVLYAAQLHNGALFLESDALLMALREPITHPEPMARRPRSTAYRMRFAGCLSPTLDPMGQTEGVSNYYVSASPSRWRRGVRSFAAVTYRDVYNGVDLEVYSSNRMLKYNWLLAPGADPAQVAMDYEGVRDVRVDRRGNLHITTALNEVVEMRPYAWQAAPDGTEMEVTSRYAVERRKDAFRVRVELGPYDAQKPLVIDPVLIFSTYTGSTADNWGTTAAYDSYRNVYTAGLVFSMGYPTSVGALDTTFNGACDVGIFKFDATGTTRLWATYLGGQQADMPHSMFVNHFDDLIIFGTTGSDDFPVTPDAFQTQFAGGTAINYESNASPYPDGSDIFVSRLSADGALEASTFVGGTGNDGLNYRNYFNNSYTTVMAGNDSLYYNYGDGARGEVITDNLGNIYIGTTTMSTDFPVSPACPQPASAGGQEGVVLKLDHNLRNIIWSTYLGGSEADAVYSVDVDSSYNLLVAGGTSSADFPVSSTALQPQYGGGTADGFVAKISYDGTRLLASTYYGSDAYDQVYFVRSGRRNEVFLFGQTAALGSTMVHNAGYSVPGSGMLLARMGAALDTLHWSTVFGTPGRINLSPTAFSADICNRVYAAGWGRDFVGYNGVRWYTAGSSGMETTFDAYSDTTDGQDFYIIGITADASRLEYATFFGELHNPTNGNRGGGDHVDGGTSRFDRMATLYQSVCASCGGFNSFPTTAGAWSNDNRSSNCNNALFRINVANDFPVADFLPPPAGCEPYTVSFTNTGRATAWHWDFGDGSTSSDPNPTHTYAHGGTYTVTLVADLPEGCAAADTQRHTLQVITPTGVRYRPQIACNNTYIQIGHTPALGTTYEWLTPGVSDSTVANPWVNAAGTYLLTTTAAGCHQTDTFEVVAYTLFDSLYALRPSCRDTADARLVVLLGPGLEPDSLAYTLAVDGVPHPIAMTAPRRLEADGLPPEARLTVAIEGYGCMAERTIVSPNAPRPDYRKQSSGWLCADSCTGWLRITPLDSLGRPVADTLFQGLCAGRHVTTVHGLTPCPVVDTTTIRVDHSLDTLRLWADRTEFYEGDTTRLHASAIGGATYAWSPATSLDNERSASPIATPPDSLTTYTLRVTSATGCSATDSITLRTKQVLCPRPADFIPNAFTPNGDGLNDRLTFNPTDIADFRILVFNRWGEVVFQADDINASWDGTYHSQPCLQGVYTYTGHYRCVNGESHDFKGDVTLIR